MWLDRVPEAKAIEDLRENVAFVVDTGWAAFCERLSGIELDETFQDRHHAAFIGLSGACPMRVMKTRQ
jgi:hypothetical protein